MEGKIVTPLSVFKKRISNLCTDVRDIMKIYM
jgi:hypothetical protein